MFRTTPKHGEVGLGRVPVLAALLPKGAQSFDENPAEVLSTRYPPEVLGVPHRVFAIVAASPS